MVMSPSRKRGPTSAPWPVVAAGEEEFVEVAVADGGGSEDDGVGAAMAGDWRISSTTAPFEAITTTRPSTRPTLRRPP